MATVDKRLHSNGGLLNQTARGYAEVEVDFADGDTYAAADVVQLIDIPADVYIKRVVVDVLTAEGATATADFGLYTTADPPVAIDADGFLDGANLNSVAKSCSQPGTLTEGTPNVYTRPYAHGVYRSAASVLCATLDHDMDAAKIKVRVAFENA